MHSVSPLLLFDGTCIFCARQSETLVRLSRGRVVALPLQSVDLETWNLTRDECLIEIKLVMPNGAVFGGARALLETLRIGRPVAGWFASVFYLPGLRRVTDAVYRWVARNRYRFSGSTEQCESGACFIGTSKESFD